MTVIGNEPAVVGVPESTPAALIVIPPATGLGLNANVGAGEPVTPVNAKLYGVPTVPAFGVPVKFGATSVFAGAITSVNVFAAFGSTPFDAVTVIGNEPAVVGVPERTPAAEIVIPPATGARAQRKRRRRRTRDAGEREAVGRADGTRRRRPGEVRRNVGVRRSDHEREGLHRRRRDAVGRGDRDRERTRRRRRPREHTRRR